ncbi:MAG: hypothetical protein RR728_03785 [Oscillospiraceae bacterium]
MALVLNILLSAISMGIFAGRLYELINLTDAATNFITFNGIIFNPYILPIFVLITICCGVLILGDIKSGKVFFARSAGVFSAFAGISFLIHIFMSLSADTNEMLNRNRLIFFVMIGAFGLIALGTVGLKGKKYEIAIVIMIIIFCIGLCLNAIVFNVSSIYNIKFLQESLSDVSIALFFLLVFKNVYSPSKYSIIQLYVAGFLCFVLCGIMSMANIAYGYISNTISVSELFLQSGYAFIGLYAAATAFLTIPNGRIETSIKDCEPEAWKSIKMLEQTQELKIPEKQSLNDIAKNEQEYRASFKNVSDKTATYKLPYKTPEDTSIDADEVEKNWLGKPIKSKTKKPKRESERKPREKKAAQEPEISDSFAKEHTYNAMDVESEPMVFKANESIKTNSDNKVVYKRPK